MSKPGRECGTIVLPAARGAALIRGLLGLIGAAPAVLLIRIVVPTLNFRHSGVSNQIEDFALAFTMILVGGAGLLLVGWAGRNLLLAFWPGYVGFVADAHELNCRLGPFGSRRLDAERMTVRYLFELDDSEREEGRFEAFLPEEEQVRTMLPRIMHPLCPRCPRLLLLRFSGLSEDKLAAMLRPAIECWREASAAHKKGDRPR